MFLSILINPSVAHCAVMLAKVPHAFVFIFLHCLLALSHGYFFGDIGALAELDSGPVIFGKDICDKSSSILVNDDLRNYASALGGGKMALRSVFDGNRVFLKKLANEEEFRGAFEKLQVFFKDQSSSGSTEQMIEEISKSLRRSEQKIILCPSETEVGPFVKEVVDADVDKLTNLVYIWTAIEVNPEPAVLQMLQPPLWPVPKYYGACGRFIIVEDCGDMLTNYYNKPFEQRARMAGKLLKMAWTFTFQHEKFAFYFTDLSPDNIAVDVEGNVRIVDLENVYVVDKNPSDISKYPEWDVNHTTFHNNCEDCYSFRPWEICSHKISDQNILSVCREILFVTSIIFKDGFLYDSPPDIFWMVHDCVNVSPGGSRFESADRLITLLEKYQDK